MSKCIVAKIHSDTVTMSKKHGLHVISWSSFHAVGAVVGTQLFFAAMVKDCCCSIEEHGLSALHFLFRLFVWSFQALLINRHPLHLTCIMSLSCHHHCYHLQAPSAWLEPATLHPSTWALDWQTVSSMMRTTSLLPWAWLQIWMSSAMNTNWTHCSGQQQTSGTSE